MALPELFLQELKMRSDMADVASSYLHLKRQGKNYVGLCPFHNEKTPSFHIYSDTNSFYCFGCGAGGDVITFIRQAENLDYMEAVRFLADRVGMQVPETQEDPGLSQLRSRILEINREAARFFHGVLLAEEGKPGLEYLRSRGVQPKTIRRFGLGYAPASRFALVDFLTDKGYTSHEITQANVGFVSRNGRLVDRFFSRVMFPIIDLRGNVVGFGGRVLTQEKPKYLNTSDTIVFKKSQGLFAMNFAKEACREQLILAEGYMDVIALHQAGFPNAAAALGTAFTGEQARLLTRYTKEVVLSYDADEAGQKAAARAIQLLREVGMPVRVLSIPNGKDPDEYIRSFGEQGPARFKQLIESSGNDVEYQLRRIREQYPPETAQGQVAYLQAAADLLSRLDSRMEQEIYAGRLAEETGVARSAILLQVDKNRKKQGKLRQKQEFRQIQQQMSGMKDAVNPEKFRHLRAANAEEGLLAFLLRGPEPGQVEWIAASLPPEQFCTEFNRRIYQRLLERLLQGKGCDLTSISETLSIEEAGALSRMLAKMDSLPLSQEDVQEYIQIILQERMKLETEQITSAQPEDIQAYLRKLKEQKK